VAEEADHLIRYMRGEGERERERERERLFKGTSQ
jgi:hypothetical protein